MTNLPFEVKTLLNLANEKERFFLGRRPSIDQISKEFNNYKKFMESKSFFNPRIKMAEASMDGEKVIGYNSFTIMQDAKATPYERKFIDMGDGLNYIYLNKIFVHPDYRKKNVCSNLIKNKLDLGSKLDKHVIFDVNKDHYRLINNLLQLEFSEDFRWETPKKIEMVRFFHE